MKRWLSFGLVFAISLVLFSMNASAAICSDDQTLFRMIGSSNAHGAEWSYSGVGYSFEVCYDDLFGSSYGGANPHECVDDNGNGVPENSVIRLTKKDGYPMNNAHAQGPFRTHGAYDYVCYGDLECRETTADCRSGEVEIVSLSTSQQGGGTNSHLGQPGTYPTKICCSSPSSGGGGGTCNNNGVCESGEDQTCSDCQGSGEITDVEWQSLGGQRIVEANNGSTVKLVAETNLGSGTVDFDVWEDDGSFGDDQIGVFQGSISNGVASVDLQITSQMIEDLDDGNDCNDGLEFFFEASITDDARTSYQLTVNCEPAPPEPPVANITAPVHKGVYYQDTIVTFEQDPGTSDTSNLEFEWTIEEDDFTSNQETFDYTFDVAGQKTITLRVTDTNTGLFDEDQVGILVVASPGMLAYVNEPFHLQLIPQTSGPNNNPRLVVEYNASDSFVVDSYGSDSDGCPTVECVAGYCPEQTENVPDGCTRDFIIIDNPDIGFNSDSEFTWNFEDGDSRIATGEDGVYGNKLFGSAFVGRRTIDVIFGFDNQNINLQKQTERMFDLGQCVNNGDNWILIGDNGKAGEMLDTQRDSNACLGIDGIGRTADDCCRSGYICDDNGNGAVVCLGSDSDVELCQDYQNQNDCEEDIYNVLEEDPKWDERPECGTYYNGDIVECSCSWRASSDSCYFNKTYTGSGTGNSDNNDDNCIYSYDMGECIDGYRTIEVTAEYNGLGDPDDFLCQNETLVVLCGSPSVDLGFFDFRQFIVGGLIVALVYFLIGRKEDE